MRDQRILQVLLNHLLIGQFLLLIRSKVLDLIYTNRVLLVNLITLLMLLRN
jgi:hypothetical protein